MSNMKNVILGTDAVDCLEELAPAAISEIKKVIESPPTKSCRLDAIPTWLLKSCLHELLPILTKIVNTSLETAHVLAAFKSAYVRPELKKTDQFYADNSQLYFSFKPTYNVAHTEALLE